MNNRYLEKVTFVDDEGSEIKGIISIIAYKNGVIVLTKTGVYISNNI
jgi:hypothetical protein